jgi:hypothetical protein
MRKIHLFIALNFLMTANACRKSEGLKPLVVHPEDVKGFWLGSAENEDQSPSVSFYFDGSHLETMTSSNEVLACETPRSYQIVNHSVLELGASGACEAASIQVTDLKSNSINISYKNVRYKLLRSNPTELEFFVSSSGAQENELSPAFRPYLIPPKDDSTIDSDLKEHQGEFYGIQFILNKKVPADANLIIGSKTPQSEQYCALIITADGNEGKTFAVDELKLEMPRDHDNIWHVRNKLTSMEVTGMTLEQMKARLVQWQSGIQSTQPTRRNRIEINNNLEFIKLQCERSLKKGLWTLADVQVELKKMGDMLRIEKIPTQTDVGSDAE